MLTFLVGALLFAVCFMAIWIAFLVRGLNDRIDQIDHALDLILDHVQKK
jgi:hypothetical protein